MFAINLYSFFKLLNKILPKSLSNNSSFLTQETTSVMRSLPERCSHKIA